MQYGIIVILLINMSELYQEYQSGTVQRAVLLQTGFM